MGSIDVYFIKSKDAQKRMKTKEVQKMDIKKARYQYR